MTSINWNLVCGLCAFVAFLLTVRNIERPRMSDRPWLRQFAQREYRPNNSEVNT